jgi:hypothetical protein
VANLLGPDLLLWSSDWVIKPAHSSSFFSFHQDSTYAGLDPPEDVVTVWLALTEAMLDNGCLQFAMGSHKLKQLPPTKTDDQNNLLSHGQTTETTESKEGVQGGEAASLAVFKPLSCSPVGWAHTSRSLRYLRTAPAKISLAKTEFIGLALRFVKPSVKPPSRYAAILVRGSDQHGHFELMQRPAADLDAALWAQHATAAMKYSMFYIENMRENITKLKDI